MCGISGYYGVKPVADQVLKNTLSVMKNRGPDYSHFVKKKKSIMIYIYIIYLNNKI
jgi:asparagine synthetase B (glutamine-hydrolysing)